MNQEAVNEFYNACSNFLEVSFKWTHSVNSGELKTDVALTFLKAAFASLLKRTKKLECYKASDIEYWENANSHNLGCFGNANSTTVASFLHTKALVASVTFFEFSTESNRTGSIEQILGEGRRELSDQLISSLNSFACSFGEIRTNEKGSQKA